MKINKFIYLALALILIIFKGCKEEFFDTPPLASETEVSFYTNFDNLDAAVIGCYSQLNTQGFIDRGNIMLFGEITSDDMEAGGKDPNDSPALQEFDRLLHTPQHTEITDVWGYGYKGIYFCNMFLKYFPTLNDGSLGDGNVSLLNIRTGEVKFLRAMYYFLLSEVFGGVVVLDEPALLSELETVKRGTVKEVYELIEQDLKDAIKLLPAKSNISDVGRASKESAQALLAKVLLFESSYAKYKAGDERFGSVQQRWDEALSFAENVIKSPSLSLPGIDGQTYETFWSPTTDAYRWLFTVQGDNSSESIFEIQSICIADGNGWIRERGNMFTKWTSFRQFTNPFTNALTDFGWGWIAPSQKLHDIFEDGDPRIKTIFGSEEDTALVIAVDNDKVEHQVWVNIVSTSPTGYNLRKYESSPDDHWITAGSEWNRGPINEKLLRLAEVYLIAAEAAYENDQTDLALTYLNTVRLRADMCDGSQDNIPSQLNSLSINDIRDERRRELAGEGHRFYDIVRWNIADDMLSDQEILGGQLKLDYVAGKHDFFPIPQTEIDVLNGAVKQYEGW